MEGNSHKLFESSRVEKLAALFLLVAALFVGVRAIDAFTDLFEPRPPMGNVISVEGRGEVVAVPDLATVTYTVMEEAQTVAAAQEGATERANVALALLKDDLGIAEEDIRTTYYNVSPRYNNRQPCYEGYCPPYEQRIIGYTVSTSVEVKVRDTAQTGAVLSALGEVGVSNLYGPSFTIDDPAALRTEARAQAIEDARAKAKVLAKDLGVRLVRVTGFWENTDPYYPYARSESAYGLGGDGAVAVNAATPEIPAGENEIVSRVTVTYEIR